MNIHSKENWEVADEVIKSFTLSNEVILNIPSMYKNGIRTILITCVDLMRKELKNE